MVYQGMNVTKIENGFLVQFQFAEVPNPQAMPQQGRPVKNQAVFVETAEEVGKLVGETLAGAIFED